jgi:hypothetical protein
VIYSALGFITESKGQLLESGKLVESTEEQDWCANLREDEKRKASGGKQPTRNPEDRDQSISNHLIENGCTLCGCFDEKLDLYRIGQRMHYLCWNCICILATGLQAETAKGHGMSMSYRIIEMSKLNMTSEPFCINEPRIGNSVTVGGCSGLGWNVVDWRRHNE